MNSFLPAKHGPAQFWQDVYPHTQFTWQSHLMHFAIKVASEGAKSPSRKLFDAHAGIILGGQAYPMKFNFLNGRTKYAAKRREGMGGLPGTFFHMVEREF